MGDINSVPNHTIDPQTGFLESLGYANAFDGDKKTAFLKAFRENGLRLRRACDSLGISIDTIHRHYKLDHVFKEQFDLVEAQYIEDLESVSKVNALNPKSVIERIFQLKCLLPDKYGQENKPSKTEITINVDGKLLQKFEDKQKVVDAQIVTSTQQSEIKSVDNQHV
jgi:hypothetical protein